MKLNEGPFPLVWIAVLLGVLLGLIWLALPLPGMDWLIPSPKDTGEGLVASLAAHRYEGAMNALSQDLRQQVKKEDLIALMERLEQSPRQGVQDAHGKDEQEQGETATATIEVLFGDNSQGEVKLPLVKENRQWKVQSIDPLRSLGQ